MNGPKWLIRTHQREETIRLHKISLRRMSCFLAVLVHRSKHPEIHAWKVNKWKKVQDIGPGSIFRSSMVYTNHGVILFVGTNPGTNEPNDNTWKWNGKFWTQSQDIDPIPAVLVAFKEFAFVALPPITLICPLISPSGCALV